MSQLILALLSVCALAGIAGASVPAQAGDHDFGAALARPRSDILTPAKREQLLEIYEAKRRDPRSVWLMPETSQPDDIDLITASMGCGPCTNDADNGVRVWCSPRDSYPGTGDPEPFLSLLFSGPRLWVLGASTVVLALATLAWLAGLKKARVSWVRLTDRAT
jgi:hypothetical protein